MGWNKKILRVDLSTGTCKTEPLNMEWARNTSASAAWPPSISSKKSTPRSIRSRRRTR
jgi:aldehyde:ferredoxin oxidoreductase